MADLDLRQLELAALDDPRAAARLVALWRRTHGHYRCAGCGEYVPTQHWDAHEEACTAARELVVASTLEECVQAKNLRPLTWGGNPSVGSIARAQPFYDREFVVPDLSSVDFFVNTTSFSAYPGITGGQTKQWGADTNMWGSHMMSGTHIFLVTGISVIPDAAAPRAALLWFYDNGSVQLRRASTEVVTLPARLVLSDQPEPEEPKEGEKLQPLPRGEWRKARDPLEFENVGPSIPLVDAMDKPDRVRFPEAKIVSMTVGGKPVVLDNAFRVQVSCTRLGLPAPFGLMAVLWGIWIAGIPG